MRILSWNICWGCMSADNLSQYDRSSQKLAMYCKHLKDTTASNMCLSNISKFLMNSSSNYDIVALQEAKNWKQIYADVNTQCSYNYINYIIRNSMGQNVEIVMFYNKTMMKPKRIFCGDLGTADTRPYQLILFELSTGQKIYIMNLHNGHNNNKPTFERIIASNVFYYNIDDFISENDNYNIEIITKDSDNESIYINNADKTETIKLTEDVTPEIFPVIMAGDFNDHGTYDYWKTGLEIKGNLVKGATYNPIRTCCSPISNSSKISAILRKEGVNPTDIYYGDYILVSSELKYNKLNAIPEHFIKEAIDIDDITPVFPTSDHLPVEANVDFKSNTIAKSYKAGEKKTRRLRKMKGRKYRKKSKRAI